MGAFGACQERPSQAFAYRKSRLPGYFYSPVFGLGCALFAAFFPAEKAAQGVRVLELVAALNSEVDLLNGGLLSFSRRDGSEPTAAAPRYRHGAGSSPPA
jgi:hypothetical protein